MLAALKGEDGTLSGSISGFKEDNRGNTNFPSLNCFCLLVSSQARTLFHIKFKVQGHNNYHLDHGKLERKRHLLLDACDPLSLAKKQKKEGQ